MASKTERTVVTEWTVVTVAMALAGIAVAGPGPLRPASLQRREST
jgi:hypothetical protein